MEPGRVRLQDGIGDDLTFDERDSAPFMPKCVVVDQNFDWQGEPPDRKVPWDRTIAYETHVKGFTMLDPEVPEELRGTYKGLGQKKVVDYIKQLGVTSVELLPIHTFVQDDNLVDKGLANYWGYNTIGFFAPTPRYAHDVPNSLREFKEMVARFHEAGLEIILDVVYNHTAEGNHLGPTLSFKGIDNASYYRLMPDDKRYYVNDTGTGNTVNLSHRRVIQMVTDSLRYWVEEMHVDGFRFDLGTILAREPNGFDNQSGFLKAVGQDPVLGAVKLIAEPWDIGPGGYQVGSFPPGWAEWTDKFRDDVRDFWRGRAGVGTLAARLCASAESFNHQGRRAWACVNFVTAHDGFTLNDTVTYDEKHNEANGEDNKDGNSDNRSWNCGVEGRPTTRRSTCCASARSATCWRRCCSRRARRCCSPATSSAAPRAATTTPIARTARSPGCTGTWRRRAATSSPSPASSPRYAASTRSCAIRASFRATTTRIPGPRT